MTLPYQYRHRKSTLVVTLFVLLALTGCGGGGGGSGGGGGDGGGNGGGGRPSPNPGLHLALPNGSSSLGITTSITDREIFQVSSSDISESNNNISVTILGLTGAEVPLHSPPQVGDTELATSMIDDDTTDGGDIRLAFILEGGAPVTDRGSGTATLTFDLRGNLHGISPFGRNTPEWTPLSRNSNIYYRNRARRQANPGTVDRRPINRDDPNYVEYHAMTYANRDRSDPGIVRVEVVLIPNYDDGVARRLVPRRNADGQLVNADGVVVTTEAEAAMDDVNANALEGENIALGVLYDFGAQTQNSNRPTTVGTITYTGRYMGWNRFTFANQAAFSPGGGVGEIPQNTAIVAKEANRPQMTITADFMNNDVDFTIHDAQLTVVDQTVGNVEIDGIMRLTINGRAGLTSSGALRFDGGEITEVNGVNLPLTFDDGTNTARLTLNPGNLTVADAAGEGNLVTANNTANNNVTGLFFDRSDDGAGRARAVAGTIRFLGTGSYRLPTPNVMFAITHEMLGVFIAEDSSIR